jgi:hypothetical protein
MTAGFEIQTTRRIQLPLLRSKTWGGFKYPMLGVYQTSKQNYGQGSGSWSSGRALGWSCPYTGWTKLIENDKELKTL